jgi:hypothetical protein
MSLWADFLTNDQKLIHKWKHYFPAYERHFARFVNTDVTVFEIGCYHGGSLQLWKRFLGPHARIVGIDLDPRCAGLGEDQIDIRIGDQSDASFLQRVVDEFGVPDIVIDDGSHVMHHLRASFDFLYPLVAKNGIYFVEDLHTSYWDEYGGGLRREGSFVEFCKSLIDELNADFARGALQPTEFTRTTLSMHFYDCVCIFEKGRTTKKHAPKFGNPTVPDFV